MYISTYQEANEAHVLLEENEKEHYRNQSLFSRMQYSFKSTFDKQFQLDKRVLKLSKKPYPRYLNNQTNVINNKKYTWYNFIFLFLYYEFSEFSNFYYLLLCITQFVDILQVGKLIRI